ncbi:MAG: efflux RND transporter permease subunit, partial [Gelidibacter sp.]
ALMPIFSFQKVEGKMFSPLAFTLGYALLGSLILSLTYVPAMCKVLLKNGVNDKESLISKFFNVQFFKLFKFTDKFGKATLYAFVGILVICAVKFHYYGTEFLPKLNEGAIYVRATLPNSIHLDESVKLAQEMKQKIRQRDEIKFVLTQTGRPNDGTDPTGFFNIEFHIQLKPEDEWERNITKDDLLAELRDDLETYPGINFGFSQPIQDNVEEYVAGVKSSLVIKIFGDDLFELEEKAHEVANAIRDVEGITDLNVYENIGQPELRIQLHDNKMAKYGVTMADAQSVVAMAIGGQAATTFYEGERMFDVRIRYQKQHRETADAIGNILVPVLDGHHVPLKEISTISFHTGPAFIYREGNSRYIGVGFSIEGRDLGSTIAEARKKVEEQVDIPSYNKVEWAGEFESKERASNQLMMVVPISLLLILFLLYMNFGNVKETVIAALTLPFAFVGGLISLWATGTVFGISAGIGFIILFGVSTINGLILITVIHEKLQERHKLKEAISLGVQEKIRPIVMIGLMGAMGLLPAALSNGMGSEIQKPLAIMIVGGILICTVLSLTVLPQLFYLAYRRTKD